MFRNFILKKKLFPLLCLLLPAGIAPGLAAVVSVNSINSKSIGLQFDNLVSAPSAVNVSNYTVFSKGTGILAVTNVVLQSDGMRVALHLNSSVDEFFAVGASNVMGPVIGTNNGVMTGFASEFISVSLGTAGNPSPLGDVFTSNRDSFDVTANGSDIGGTDDHGHFVYEQVIGDFEMATMMTRLDNTDPHAKAGLMVRESLAAGSRSFGIYFTPEAGSREIQMIARTTTDGFAQFFATSVSNAAFSWLRVTRTNNILSAYYGTDGSSWIFAGCISIAISNTLYAGLAATSHTNGHDTTASFNSFGVAGARPGDNVLPTLSVAVFQTTNLIAKWQRTPRDFTVQVSPSLVLPDPTDTNAMPWAFLAVPVFDTSLTGTNAAMPTPGRYMTIPMNLFSNNQIFVRLAKVDRVIPDPISVTAGTIFSQAGGSLKTTAIGPSICGTPVNTASAVAQVGVPILCPAGRKYQFTTSSSGSALQTVIQVRNYPTIGISTCDASFTAGRNKSQVTVTQTDASILAGYTFIAVVTSTSTKPTVTCPIKVTINY